MEQPDPGWRDDILTRAGTEVKLGRDVKIYPFTNIYGCEIGDETRVGTFVEIQKGAKIGRRVKVSSHTFICEGVTIEDQVFIGHGVVFTNDRYPRATNEQGELQTAADWQCIPTLVKRGASIGSNATILAGITIGEGAIVGAGSTVTHDVPPGAIVAGNPARILRHRQEDIRSNNMNIPLVDLQAQYKPLKGEILGRIEGVLDGMRLFLGENQQTLEAEFARYCGARHAIAVGDGTIALELILRGYGIGQGDEVITVSHTFFATTEAIVLNGARPVFVDIDPVTYLMNVEQITAKITPHTKAILPVHLYGQTADMDAIRAIAAQHGLRVIEDACQAHGAEYRDRKAGNLGDAAAFSFYFSKNLGAYGEAGMITTNDDDLATHIRMLRDHGSAKRYHHDLVGINGRMDEIQAAILRAKLPHLDEWNNLRRTRAQRYNQVLAGTPLSTPVECAGNTHVYHLYVVGAPRRDALQAWLRERNIGTGIHYPIPSHLQTAVEELGYQAGDLPVTEYAAAQILSLPMYPELTDEQIDYIAGAIKDFYQESAG